MEKLQKLKHHDFISYQQARFLQTLKESLADEEAIVIADFSENYSFVL